MDKRPAAYSNPLLLKRAYQPAAGRYAAFPGSAWGTPFIAGAKDYGGSGLKNVSGRAQQLFKDHRPKTLQEAPLHFLEMFMGLEQDHQFFFSVGFTQVGLVLFDQAFYFPEF